MKNFIVNITVEDPFPKTEEQRIEASKIEVAVARGLRDFRRDSWKGRPLKSVRVVAKLIE